MYLEKALYFTYSNSLRIAANGDEYIAGADSIVAVPN